jgi:hypothetical protein
VWGGGGGGEGHILWLLSWSTDHYSTVLHNCFERGYKLALKITKQGLPEYAISKEKCSVVSNSCSLFLTEIQTEAL